MMISGLSWQPVANAVTNRAGKDAVAKPREVRKARRLEGVPRDLFDGCSMSRMRGVLGLMILMAGPDKVKPKGLGKGKKGEWVRVGSFVS